MCMTNLLRAMVNESEASEQLASKKPTQTLSACIHQIELLSPRKGANSCKVGC